MKRLFIKLFDFYLNSSIHVSVAVVCLAMITFKKFSVQADPDLLAFIFFGTVSSYNFVKYAGIAKLHHLSLTKDLRYIQIFSFLSFIALIYFLFQQSLQVLVVSGFLAVVTLLYALPVFNQNRNLRAIPGIKIYVIAFVWAGATVLLPVMEQNFLSTGDVFLEFFQRFLFVIVLLLPFEIRDLKFDMAQLNTIPQIFGIYRTKIFGFLLLGGFYLLEFIKDETSFIIIASLLVITVIMLFLIKNTRIRQGRYYSSFWVEAMPIFWWGLLELLISFNW